MFFVNFYSYTCKYKNNIYVNRVKYILPYDRDKLYNFFNFYYLKGQGSVNMNFNVIKFIS